MTGSVEPLKLTEIDRKEVILADGSRQLVPYVGPIEIRFKTNPKSSKPHNLACR